MAVDRPVASDYASLRPVPPYLRGESDLLPLETIRTQFGQVINGLLHSLDATPTVLVVHGGAGDLECLRIVMGIDPAVLLPLSPRLDEQPRLQLGKLLVVDTQHLSAAVAVDPLPSQTLKACCHAIGINVRHEHHAGNDALWCVGRYLRRL